MRSERASLTPHVIIEGDDDMRARNYEKMEKSMDWWGVRGEAEEFLESEDWRE